MDLQLCDAKRRHTVHQVPGWLHLCVLATEAPDHSEIYSFLAGVLDTAAVGLIIVAVRIRICPISSAYDASNLQVHVLRLTSAHCMAARKAFAIELETSIG